MARRTCACHVREFIVDSFSSEGLMGLELAREGKGGDQDVFWRMMALMSYKAYTTMYCI
jgi:hypothetical protein